MKLHLLFQSRRKISIWIVPGKGNPEASFGTNAPSLRDPTHRSRPRGAHVLPSVHGLALPAQTLVGEGHKLSSCPEGSE